MLRNGVHNIWYASVKTLAQVLFVCLFRVRAFGWCNIPKRGGAVLASNHQSYLDPAIIAVGARREIHFMARDSLFEIPVFGALIRSLNAFPVKRDGIDRKAIRKAVRIVAEGGLVVIFPEGMRHDSGTLGEMKSGATFVSRKAGCPIIPVGIQGAHKAWPIRYRICHLASIRIRFGRPIESDGKEAGEMIGKVVEGIEGLLE